MLHSQFLILIFKMLDRKSATLYAVKLVPWHIYILVKWPWWYFKAWFGAAVNRRNMGCIVALREIFPRSRPPRESMHIKIPRSSRRCERDRPPTPFPWEISPGYQSRSPGGHQRKYDVDEQIVYYRPPRGSVRHVWVSVDRKGSEHHRKPNRPARSHVWYDPVNKPSPKTPGRTYHHKSDLDTITRELQRNLRIAEHNVEIDARAEVAQRPSTRSSRVRFDLKPVF